MIELSDYKIQPNRTDPSSNAAPLTTQATAQLLNDIINGSVNHCLVFDLDSTLLDNKPRNTVIMQEFAQYIGEPKLAIAKPAHFQDWSARNAMLAIGLSPSEADQFVDDYVQYWTGRFFSSEYCHHDIAIPGAAEFVNAVENAGGSICYLTGRHEGMRAGTEASLKKLGFPVPGTPGVELRMKPKEDQSDDTYKVDTLETLKDKLPVLAAFDNEPTHINSYKVAFPKSVCVHLLTDHSMRDVKLLNGIVSIEHFLH